MTQKEKILKFKAIPLWEVIVSFFVMLFLVYGISEYVILRITTNTTIHTQLIIFTLILLLSLEYAFHFKRAKDFYIKINELENIIKIVYSDKLVFDDIHNINIVKFLLRKTLSYTLIVNNKLYLIYKKDAVLAKSDKKKIKTEMESLIKIIKRSEFPKRSSLNLIPKVINITFYLLLIISFSLFLFVFVAIFTENTIWFENFK